jgi:hypothetical protein
MNINHYPRVLACGFKRALAACFARPFPATLVCPAKKGLRMLDDLKEKIAPMVARLAEMRGYL